MKVAGAELLGRQPTVKFILNETAIVFFLAAVQHRDVKADGLSYEDDYRGNAVAGIASPERVDIRFHQAFSDERICGLWRRVVTAAELGGKQLGKLYYQGREIR
jgi:hypothetical protein